MGGMAELDRSVSVKRVPGAHTQSIANRRGHTLLADEPASLGGADRGFSPFELVAAGLGACTAITLRMYARHKKLALDDVAPHMLGVTEFCSALVPHGVKFCLSRFEGGADGDAVLEQLPVDYIKLAPKYLAAAAAPGLRDELRVIVDRAHRRGLAVIAPRVEDAQSAATLWMSGIDYIQGNLVQLATRELDFDFQAAVL